MALLDSMSDLDRLLAYGEIRQLAARYALAVDSRDVDALVQLFVDDVRAGGGRRGRDALRESFEGPLRAEKVSILSIGTHVINLLDRDHAAGTVYCTCEMGDEKRWARQAIVYEDDYRRQDEHWYFVRRKHLLFYGREPDDHPLDQPPAKVARERRRARHQAAGLAELAGVLGRRCRVLNRPADASP